MLSYKNHPVNPVIEDLEMLMQELEKKPQLSSWVVRMTLKAIKDKAEKIATDTAQQAACQQELALRN